MDIGLIGFGGVGQALIKLLIDKESYLLQQYNLKINVKYIIKSKRKGRDYITCPPLLDVQ